jgi:hypothetical protein
MKKLVFSALALSATSAAGLASESDWSSLDQQIEALTTSLAVDNHGGPNFSGRIRTYYVNSGDVVGGLDSNGDPNDLGGFAVADARLSAEGSRGDYDYKLQVDFADEPELLDAYATFPIGGQVKGRMGQFKANLSRSALVSSGKLVFIDRNVVGNLFSNRDAGFLLSGEFDALDWGITIQNGGDGGGDEYFIVGKVSFDVLGDGKDLVEGAYGGTDEPSGTVGVAFYDDGATQDGDGTLFEAAFGTNVYSFGVDIVDIGDGLVTSNGTPVVTLGAGALEANTTPFSVFGTYMLQPETWEVALRYQDLDNDANEDKIDVSVSNYIDGHNLKWQLQYSTVSSDVTANEIDSIWLGLQVGF